MDHKKYGPRDVFAYLLAMIGLYVSVISFGTILFQYINIYLPDLLTPESIGYSRGLLRWPLSILVIVFPLFVWLSAYLQKDLVKNPAKRELKTRKWLLYLTLFITTIVMVGDVVTLLYRFLNGELTTRFVLKVLTLLVLGAVVFIYYSWNLRKEIPASSNPSMRIFLRGVLGLAAVAILFGFFVAGSPQTERARRFDDQRISDLQNIQYQVVNYWQAKQKLPATLSDVRDDIRGVVPPMDPETGAPYEYRTTAVRSFELCATFTVSNKDQSSTNPKVAYPVAPYETAPYGSVSDNFLHDAGHQCFSRTIDPDLYPPIKSIKQ